VWSAGAPFAQGHEQVEIPDNLELLFRQRFSQIVKSKTKSKFRALQAAIFDYSKAAGNKNPKNILIRSKCQELIPDPLSWNEHKNRRFRKNGSFNCRI
jgi:hypothetical protein